MRNLFIIGILSARLTAYSQTTDICLTPNEYRFYAGAVIDAQVLKKDTSRLNSAVKSLIKAHVADSTANAKQESVIALHGEKEAVYTHKINLLQDDIDGKTGQITRNRKIAIIGWGSFTIETGLLILGIWAMGR